jgi:hypothetical protein
MAYDAMGNYTGFDDSASEPVNPYDFEEENKRKEELKRQLKQAQREEEELASKVSHKEEITKYGDGSQTVKTTKEIPAGGPVAPDDYNANIARQESGNNPNIGYHDRSKGTASGMYGMTDAGYADARKLDPNLPADRLQSTPEQQTAAQNAYTQQNAKYLQNYGVEPTSNNLAAAHFLGAKGLSDYLKTGYISDAAAKANGGIENVKRIVNQRLGGQAAPASGAAQQQNLMPGEQGGMPTKKPQLQPVSPEQAQQQEPSQQPPAQQPPAQQPPAQAVGPVSPEQAQQQAQGPKPNSYDEFGTPGYSEARAQLDKHVDAYTTAQNDPNALMALSANKEVPDWMQERSRNRAADIITQQREMKNAQEKLAEASPTDLAKYMREKSTGGSWIKAIFYASIGAKSLAQAEGAKLGIGTEKIVTDANGKSHIVKVASNGTPLEGYSSETGKKMTAEEMVAALGGAAPGANKWNTTAETYTDKAGNLYQKQNNERGQTRIVNAKSGERYTGDETLKRERDVAGAEADTRKQGFKRENDATQFANSIRKLDYAGKLKAVEEFQQAAVNRGEPLLTDEELSRMGVDRPDISTPTRQQPGQAKPAAAPAPAAAPQGAVAAPIAPTPEPGQPATAIAPVDPNAPAPSTSVTGRMTPEAMKRQEAVNKLARESESTVKTTEQNEYVKETKPAVGLTSSDGQAVSNARRQQLDIVKRNPSVVNILNGQGTQYDQARRIMINAVSGAYGSEEKKQLADDLGQVMNKLTESEQGALQEFVNLNTIVNAKTLRANAGPGAVSDAEQRANKEANVGNVDRIPAYAAMAGLHRSQFNGDLAASKQAFLQANPQIKTTSEFNSAWQKQEAVRLKEYQGIAKARFDVMGKAPATSAGPEAVKAYRDRVFRAFEAYPAPQYDAATNKWNYQTANARRAAMASVLGQ